jgi:pSer/pThr/pTyr-binding forkhead associated (FHA) protein
MHLINVYILSEIVDNYIIKMNKEPTISIFKDVLASYPIKSLVLEKDKPTIIGYDQLDPFHKDSTVEASHISAVYSQNTVTIENMSTSQGTFVAIQPHAIVEISYSHSIVIGNTFLQFTQEGEKVVITFIRQDFTIIFCYRVEYGAVIVVGRDPCMSDISVKEDLTISRKHLKLTFTKAGISCEDLGSVNRVFVQVEKLTLNENVCSELIRIGISTFVKYELKEEKNRIEFFMPQNPSQYVMQRAKVCS